MSVSSEFSETENALKIKIDGRFGYELHQDFTSCYKHLPQAAAKKLIIDLSRASYIDSAALGMLLVLRERVGGDRSDITLTGANREIEKVLDITNFEKLFKVK
ncbi:MAG: STAS domain-containing protein [Gammaproteobacteria bacterium]